MVPPVISQTSSEPSESATGPSGKRRPTASLVISKATSILQCVVWKPGVARLGTTQPAGVTGAEPRVVLFSQWQFAELRDARCERVHRRDCAAAEKDASGQIARPGQERRQRPARIEDQPRREGRELDSDVAESRAD